MFALVDCNNFYASCKRVFNPEIISRPVIVLSNNDGCVIARCDKEKVIGFKMGDPFFKVPELVQRHGVAVFSCNYTLYGDMSSRVMDTLGRFAPEVEVYSIDEAFMNLAGFPRGWCSRPGRRDSPHRQVMDRNPGVGRHWPHQDTGQGGEPDRLEEPGRRRRLDHRERG